MIISHRCSPPQKILIFAEISRLGFAGAQPRAFSPQGNTFNTQTTISFALDNPASVTVKVYNVAGNLVKLIAHDRLLSAGANALFGDGKDEVLPPS